jgi:CHAT domain-containing protein/tetratricopeptide (TPR) repeat protein
MVYKRIVNFWLVQWLKHFFKPLFVFLLLSCSILNSSAQKLMDTALFNAIKKQDIKAVEKALKNNIAVNATDSNGANALMWAVYYGNLPIVKYLVQQGAKVPDSAVIFINQGTSFYGNLQGIAASQGRLGLLQYLADSLHLSLDEKGFDPVSRKNDSWTPLFWAASGGRTGVVQYLLQKKVQADMPDAEGCCTPLTIAADYHQMGSFVLLMNTEANRKRFGKQAEDLIKEANKLAEQNSFISDFNNDIATRQFVIKIKKAYFGDTHFSYAKSLNELADVYLKTNDPKQAKLFYLKAADILEKAAKKDHPEYAHSLIGMSNYYVFMEEYEKALPLMEQALAIRKETLGYNDPEYPLNLHNLAFLHERLGHYDKSLLLYQQALDILKNNTSKQDSISFSTTSGFLANLYGRLAQYDKALTLLKQTAIIKKAVWGPDDYRYANTLNDLANLYQSMGRYDKALPLLLQTISIRKNQVMVYKSALAKEMHPDYAQSLNDLAVLYEHLGQYDKARHLYENAAAILKEVLEEGHSKYITVLENLAGLYEHIKLYDTAKKLYNQVLKIRAQVMKENASGKNFSFYAASLHNLAGLYYRTGQLDSALSLLKKAETIRKKIPGENHPDYANTLAGMAQVLEQKGQYNEARSLLQRAIAINKKAWGEEHPGNTKMLINLGLFTLSPDHLKESSALIGKANTIELRQLMQTFATLSEQEKIAFLNKESYQFNYLPSLLFIYGTGQPELLQQVYTSESSLKGIVLEDQQTILNNIRKSGDSIALQLYDHWRYAKAFLGQQLLLPIRQRIAYIDSLQEEVNQLEQQLSLRTLPFRNQQIRQHITVKEIAGKIEKGQAAIEFVRFQLYNGKWTDSTLYAAMILLHGDSVARFVPLFEEKQLQLLLQPTTSGEPVAIQQLYRGADVSDNAAASSNDSLYQLVWKPLESYLEGVQTVYYAPAGLLHRIAFQALRTDSAHLLIDKYRLHQVLSTRFIAEPAKPDTKPITASLWGNIDYDLPTDTKENTTSAVSSQNADTASSFDVLAWDTRSARNKEWKSLPDTRLETDSLYRVLMRAGVSTTPLSGTKATEEVFKALNGKSPQVLHLATHGFFLPVTDSRHEDDLEAAGTGNAFTVQQNPMFRSGLILAGGNHTWKGAPAATGKEDGILTAYEIAQMDLSNTGLMVLSACETALGDLQGNEGVIGLQRALKMAGVKQMIVSLWPVPDKSTMELMTLFYKNWLGGASAREALRTAQLIMKQKYPLPFNWAAFVLVE